MIPTTWRVGTRTDVGHRRERNEDALLSAPERSLFAVADGMGGHPAGDVASRMATRLLAEAFRTARPAPTSSSDAGVVRSAVQEAEAILAETFEHIHDALRAHGRETSDDAGLGTTLTALRIAGGTAAVGHVGDSRLYRLRAGELHQLTKDHTWVQREVDEGRLDPRAARTHPYSAVLLRVLGSADAHADVFTIDVAAGDRLLLCTDGVSGLIDDDALAALLDQPHSADEIADMIVDAALDNGGHDNATAIVLLAD